MMSTGASRICVRPYSEIRNRAPDAGCQSRRGRPGRHGGLEQEIAAIARELAGALKKRDRERDNLKRVVALQAFLVER